MFGMGMPEMILILAVALIVIGPKKLPELAKSLGKGIVEFKRATQDFRDTIDIESEVGEFRDTVDTIKTDIRHQLTENQKDSSLSTKNTEISTPVETTANKSLHTADTESAPNDSLLKETQATKKHEK